MLSTDPKHMGKVVTSIKVTNFVDKVFAERGFIRPEQIRTLSIDDVIVGTGATMLCLPSHLIQSLGLRLAGEVDTRIVVLTNAST